MLTPDFIAAKFDAGLSFARYVETAKGSERSGWQAGVERVRLTPAQAGLVAGFTRHLRVLVTSGTWCGDCVAQCPMIAAIEAANPARIAVRFLDRDAHADLAERVKICGGLRVPTAIFANEDSEFLAILGDRTLSRYRAIAAQKLGAACPVPGAPIPASELAATLQDWVDEFERAHLVVRLSPKLRERHGD